MARDRLLAIGDIHGCRDRLDTLLDKVAPTQRDQVVFLGDYVDRGPDSAGVISDLLDFRQRFPQTVFLCGNHERMFLDYLEGGEQMMFLLNGGTSTLDSYRKHGHWPIPESHYTFLATLECAYETEEHIFVHAGLRPGAPLAEQKEHDLLWIRREFLCTDYDWGKIVVYGHTPRAEAHLSKTRIGLDTGCVYGRQLTCCDVQTRTLWHA